MIHITRSQSAPRILQRNGKAQTALDQVAYDNGTRDFAWRSSLYSHPSVRAALRRSQHNKCAYCETKLVRQRGRIDHFRPKDGIKQDAGDEMQKPGYYWLAYDWSNLLLTCENCNDQGYKGNLFPLSDPILRATSHRCSTASENPLLIDPAQEDPEKLISFREEFAFAVNDNERGRVTRNMFGLNTDDDLVGARRKHLQRLRALLTLVQAKPMLEAKLKALDRNDENFEEIQRLSNLAAEAQNDLDFFVTDAAEYASMARANLSAKSVPPLQGKKPPMI